MLRHLIGADSPQPKSKENEIVAFVRLIIDNNQKHLKNISIQ